MSRAFINEDQLTENTELPEREVSRHPNYVTAQGLTLLKQRFAALENERSSLLKRREITVRERLTVVERDLRYYAARIESARQVPAPLQAPEQVTFGCRVTIATPAGDELSYTLVGEDEADVKRGLVSWVSPLGQALLGAREGNAVTWRRPAGDTKLEILEISTPETDTKPR